MADEMEKIANRARRDANRASQLATAIEAIAASSKTDYVKITVDFIAIEGGDEAGKEVVAAIIRMWLVIWEETLRASRDELAAIQDRYAPLMQEEARYD
ncbi:hypothetical protein HJA90_10340 [Rhizobium bangladeshense]|uniref:hypothetical protein n=1 Tax=Rhizobium bangladeshense TaxID=1138189 RepID=UPI001C83CAD4|nr:hypothetical protein [Rhizobium bangladeshense]MBX4883980.1 hypothetical protein [Rhizobium bangladeshense]